MHHSVLEEGRVFHGTGALITSLSKQNIPPMPAETTNLPVPQKIFYSNGVSEASISLHMNVVWENATINVSLRARPEGGEWMVLFSRSGGEEGQMSVNDVFVLGGAKDHWEIELSMGAAATSINTSSNFEIVKLASEQRYEGQWINRSFLSRRPATYSQSTSMAAARELQNNPGLFAGFSAAFKDIVHSFFTHIVQAVSEMICDLLFGSRRPVLRIDPLDGDSIIETTRQTTTGWVTVGFNRLRLLLRDDDFVINACKQVMKDIMAGLAEVVKGVLTGFLNAVGDFIERAMDWLISGFCSVIGAIGGFAADAIEFFTFGMVQADGIRDTVSSLVKGAESYWEAFKNTIKGVIQGFLDVVYQVIDNIAEMVGEVIGAILGRLAILFRGLIDAFLISARTIITGLVDYMLVGSAVSAVEYRETMVKAGQSLDVGEFVFEGENSTKSFQVDISQDPKYLSRYDPRFIMEVGAPKGMHYTAANSISNHPYETTWEVLVMGEVWINATSGGSPLAEMNGLSNLSSRIFLNVSIPITVFSGWPLRGAEYKASNTLLEDLKTLFQLAWEKLTSVFEGIIHFIKKAADLFSRLIQEILSRAMQLVEMLENVFEKAMDLFAKLLTGIGYKIARELLHLFLGDNDQLGPITVFGFTLLIVVRQTTDAAWLNVSLSREGGGFGAWANLSEDDASLHAHMAFWNLRASGTITSFVNREYNGFVEWNDNGRGWIFNFHGPREVEYAEATVSLASTMGRGWVVPTPAGPATVDVGLVLRLDMARIEGAMSVELGSLGAMLMEGPGKVMERLDPREDIEGTSELARGVAEFAFSGDPLDRLERTLLNVSDAMVLEMFLDISLGAGVGPGCRLSILIYDPIVVLSELIPWLLSTIGGAVSGLLGEAGANAGGRMTYSPPSRGLSRHAMESIALRLKVYGGSDSLGREIS
ncbi:MAG: hypothetical protein QCI38_06110, partial [Candidatus Thermoplasmatota archaeon]|nr:hypothetical protein [Candidatus Thermoplasmatota archaeon]